MENKVNIVVCADKNIEVGLHVTLYTLLENTHRKIRIYFINDGYTKEDMAALHKTLEPFNGSYELIPILFSVNNFKQFPGLFGNQFIYAKMIIADLVNEERILYLDSDLIIKLDIADLFAENLNGKIIGCCLWDKIDKAQEKDFFLSLGLSPEAPFFSSGLLLMDLYLWRKFDITNKCMQFANEYSHKLTGHDQTILNYVLYNNFQLLDEKYFTRIWPEGNPRENFGERRIYHLVGVPKPWDFLGELFHRNYPLFKKELKKTYFHKFRSYSKWNIKKLVKSVRLLRYYQRSLRMRIFGR